MKKLVSLIILAIAFISSPEVNAQEFSGMDASPADIASYPTDYKDSEKLIRVIYSRPQLKGRSLSELAPAGKVWRTGANEAVEITLYEDAEIAGEELDAGTYSVFTVPGEDEWTVIFNKNLNQWGAYFYEESGDVARVKAQVSEGDKSLEAFSIAFQEVGDEVHMVMGWDTTRVAVPISFEDE